MSDNEEYEPEQEYYPDDDAYLTEGEYLEAVSANRATGQ